MAPVIPDEKKIRSFVSEATFRTNTMKTPAGRTQTIAALVAMLGRGKTIVPGGTR